MRAGGVRPVGSAVTDPRTGGHEGVNTPRDTVGSALTGPGAGREAQASSDTLKDCNCRAASAIEPDNEG